MKFKLLPILIGLLFGFLSITAQESILLHDNGGFITHYGAGANGADVSDSDEKALGMGTYIGDDSWVCEDFTIAEGEYYKIDSVVFVAGLNNNNEVAYSPIDELYVVVLDSSPVYNENPKVLYGSETKDVYYSSRFSGVYRVRSDAAAMDNDNMPIHYVVWKPVNLVVNEGTYWLKYTFGMSDGDVGSPTAIFANYTEGSNNGGHYKPSRGWAQFYNWIGTATPGQHEWSWETSPLKVYGSVSSTDIPALATDLDTKINGTELKTTVSWINPSKNIAGDDLSAVTKVEVYVNDSVKPAAVVTEGLTVGGASSATVDVPSIGFHNFKVVCSNDNGTGLPTEITGWGGDPKPVLEVSTDSLDFGPLPILIKGTSRNITLTNWGYNTYKITDLDFPTLPDFKVNTDYKTIKLAYGESATFSIKFDPVLANKIYEDSIKIISKEDIQTISIFAESRPEPIYRFNRHSPLYPEEWFCYNKFTPQYNWRKWTPSHGEGQYSMGNVRPTQDEESDFLITQSIIPTPNNDKLEFFVKGVRGTNFLNVLVSETTIHRDSFVLVDSVYDMRYATWTHASVDLSAYHYKPIYVGFINSSLNTTVLNFDDMYGPFNSAKPGMVTNLTATPSGDNLQTIDLAWNNPDKSYFNDSLMSLTAIEIYVNNADVPVKTIETTERGAALTAQIKIPHGPHQINFVAVNEYGSGERAPVKVYSGTPYEVLVDSVAYINMPGAGSDETDLSALHSGMGSIGYYARVFENTKAADEIIIPTGEAWDLRELTFYAFQGTKNKQDAKITAVNIAIWNGVPSAEGSEVIYTNEGDTKPLSTYHTGHYRNFADGLGATWRSIMEINCDLPRLVLQEGSYWVEIQMAGTHGPWILPRTIAGKTTTGNAMHFKNDAWEPMLDEATNTAQGLPFKFTGNRVDVSCIASLTGTVSNSAGLMANVDVTAKLVNGDASFYGTTNKDGVYNINHLICGDYYIDANIFGYYAQDLPLTLTQGQSSEMNITLVEIPEYEVKGRFVDGLGNPISNVAITMKGYDNYETVSGNDGTFSVPNVYKSSENYFLKASRENFLDVTVDFKVDKALDLGDLLMNDVPRDVFAVVANPGDTNAVVSWLMPDDVDMYSTQFDAMPENYIAPAYNITNGKLLYNTTDTETHPGGYFNADLGHFEVEMKMELGTFNEGGFFLNADTVIGTPVKTRINGYKVLYSPTFQGFEFGIFRDGIYQTISGFRTIPGYMNTAGYNVFKVAVHFNEFAFYFNGRLVLTLEHDEIPFGKAGFFAHHGIGNSISCNVDYFTTNITGVSTEDFVPSTSKASKNSGLEKFDVYQSRDEFLMAGGLDKTQAESVPVISGLSNFKGSSKGMHGLNVYRINYDSILTPRFWTTVVSQVSATTIIDDEWPVEHPGIYYYGVEANYPNDVKSKVKLSNQFTQARLFDLKLQVNSNNGEDTKGGVVTVNNTEVIGFYQQKKVWTDGGVNFRRLYKGNYAVTVNKQGFEYFADTFNIQSDTTITIELKEAYLAPRDLAIVNDTLTWNNAFVNYYTGFEDGYMPHGFNHYIITNKGVHSKSGFPNTWHVSDFVWKDRETDKIIYEPNGKYSMAIMPSGGSKQYEVLAIKPIKITPYTKIKFRLFTHIEPLKSPQHLNIGIRNVGNTVSYPIWYQPRLNTGTYDTIVEVNAAQFDNWFGNQDMEIIFEVKDGGFGLDFPVFIDDFEIYEDIPEAKAKTAGNAKAPSQFKIIVDDLDVGTSTTNKFALTDVEYGEHEFGVQAIYQKEQSEITYKTINYQKTTDVVFDVVLEDGKVTTPNWVVNMNGAIVSLVNGKAKFTEVIPGVYPVNILKPWDERWYLDNTYAVIYDTVEITEDTDTLKYTGYYFNPEVHVTPETINAQVSEANNTNETLTVSNSNHGGMDYHVVPNYIVGGAKAKAATVKRKSKSRSNIYYLEENKFKLSGELGIIYSKSSEPKASNDSTVLHHDGAFTGTAQIPTASFTGAVKFTGTTMENVAGQYLTSVDFWVYGYFWKSPLSLRIYSGTSDGKPTTLIKDIPLDKHFLVAESWNTYTFEEPILLTTDDLWIGIYVSSSMFGVDGALPILGLDSQTAKPNGQLVGVNGLWGTLSEAFGEQFDHNWSIRGTVKGFDYPWIELVNYKGELNKDQSANIDVKIKADELDEGEYKAELIVLNEDKMVTVPVSLSVVTSINDDAEKMYVAVYPNPTSSVLNVKSDKTVESVKLYSIAGELVYTSNALEINPSIDVSNFEDGYYIIEINIAGVTAKQKIIIQ